MSDTHIEIEQNKVVTEVTQMEDVTTMEQKKDIPENPIIEETKLVAETNSSIENAKSNIEDTNDSTSSSDSSDSEVELEIEKAEVDEDDELDENVIPKTKNEIAELPPPEPITLTILPEHTLVYIGTMSHTVDNLVVVESDKRLSNFLDLENVLCLQDRIVLGRIEEVFGPVQHPFYTLRFKDEAEAKQRMQKGTPVFFVPELSQYIKIEEIKNKGSDASNANDEEPLPEEIEYSDDEEEAKAKATIKASKQKNKPPKKKANKPPKQVQPTITNQQPSYQYQQSNYPTMDPNAQYQAQMAQYQAQMAQYQSQYPEYAYQQYPTGYLYPDNSYFHYPQAQDPTQYSQGQDPTQYSQAQHPTQYPQGYYQYPTQTDPYQGVSNNSNQLQKNDK